MNKIKNFIMDKLRNPYNGLLYSFLLMFILGITFGPRLKEGTFWYELATVIRITLIIIMFVSLVRIIISFFNKTKQKYDNDNDGHSADKKNTFHGIDVYPICLIGVPIFFIIITVVYHNSGPRGVVNSGFSKSVFVSCHNNGWDNGYKIYYCKRRGETFILECAGSSCDVNRLRGYDE